MKGEGLVMQLAVPKGKHNCLVGLLYLSLCSIASAVEILVYVSYSTPALDFQSPFQVNEQSLKEIGRRRKCRGDSHGVRMGTSGKGEAGEKGVAS